MRDWPKLLKGDHTRPLRVSSADSLAEVMRSLCWCPRALTYVLVAAASRPEGSSSIVSTAEGSTTTGVADA